MSKPGFFNVSECQVFYSAYVLHMYHTRPAASKILLHAFSTSMVTFSGVPNNYSSGFLSEAVPYNAVIELERKWIFLDN
jgi:hypothetical protein